MTSLSITRTEWFAARSAVVAAAPSETDPSHGVAVFAVDGLRWWTAWTDDVIVTTAAFRDSGEVQGATLVSPRLVTAAAHLAHELDDDIALDVGGDRATLSASEVLLTLQAPAPRAIPAPVPASGDVAVGEVGAGDLYRLFDIAGVLPVGVDPGEVDLPGFVLQIWESGIGAWVDWSGNGVPATRLDIATPTNGGAHTTLFPDLALRVIGQIDPDDEVTVAIPDGGDWVSFETPGLTARIRSGIADIDEAQTVAEFEQLALFDPDAYFGRVFVDPFAGWSLTDIRALSIDPDPQVRARATKSRFNWDEGIQLQFASDPDESVVLALLDNVDPGMSATRVIIDSPHVEARRVLAARNLKTELLLLLAADHDPIAGETARNTLARRGVDVPAVALERS